MVSKEIYRTPTTRELEERDFFRFKEKVKRLSQLEMYSVLGQAIAFCAHDENDSRKAMERNGRKDYVDGVQKFINIITGIDTETISLSFFREQIDRRRVAKSMHEISDLFQGEKPKNSDLIYHTCAYILGRGYKGVFGWEGLGRKVADSLNGCSSYGDLRDCIIKGLNK